MLESIFNGCKINALFVEANGNGGSIKEGECIDPSDKRPTEISVDGVTIIFQTKNNKWSSIHTSEWGSIGKL